MDIKQGRLIELPVNHYIAIHSMNILSQTYIRVVNMLIVVEWWWFNVVGPRLRAICNLATPGNRANIFCFVPTGEQSVVSWKQLKSELR